MWGMGALVYHHFHIHSSFIWKQQSPLYMGFLWTFLSPSLSTISPNRWTSQLMNEFLAERSWSTLPWPLKNIESSSLCQLWQATWLPVHPRRDMCLSYTAAVTPEELRIIVFHSCPRLYTTPLLHPRQSSIPSPSSIDIDISAVDWEIPTLSSAAWIAGASAPLHRRTFGMTVCFAPTLWKKWMLFRNYSNIPIAREFLILASR